jgi:hypothetical protein
MKTFSGIESVGLIPKLEKYIIQSLVSFAVVMQDTVDHAAKSAFVSLVNFFNRVGLASANSFHQFSI